MYATGAHCELSNLAAELRTMRAEIKAEYEAKRAAEQARMVDMEKRMMDALKSRQETLLKLLSNKFDVNGVKDNGVKATLTRGDIAAAVNNALLKEDGPIATLMSRMDTIEQSAGAATATTATTATTTATTTAATTEIVPDVGDKGDNVDVQINYNAMLHLWQRDGLFHTVPEGFIFPSCSVATVEILGISTSLYSCKG